MGSCMGSMLRFGNDHRYAESEASFIEGLLEQPPCQLCGLEVETNNELYGLLPACGHAFCYPCISAWCQRLYPQRCCPICWTIIFHVIRSPVFYEHETANKQKLLLGYIRDKGKHQEELINGLTLEQYIKYIVCPVRLPEKLPYSPL